MIDQMANAIQMLLQNLADQNPEEDPASWAGFRRPQGGSQAARARGPAMPRGPEAPTATTIIPSTTPIRCRWSQRCQQCLDGLLPGMMVVKKTVGWCHASCEDPMGGFVEPRSTS